MKKQRNLKWTVILVCFFIFLFIFSYYFFVSLPIIKTYSKAEVDALTEQAVNIAVSNVINRTLSYDTLIDINYSPNGEITSFSANQYEINSITREIVKETQHQIGYLGNDGIRLNFGTLLGFPLFVGRGAKIKFNLVPIGVVNGAFESNFNSVGINMTKHSLLLNVNVHVSMVLPIKTFDIYTSNQVLLAESIIVGKVPEVYLNGGSLGKSLNLVP